MIDNAWICAPAGVPGPGGLVARAGTGRRPVAVRLRVLATPVVDVPAPVIAPTGVRFDGTAVPAAPQFGTAAQHNQDNGTTLGIHSSGRPLS